MDHEIKHLLTAHKQGGASAVEAELSVMTEARAKEVLVSAIASLDRAYATRDVLTAVNEESWHAAFERDTR